MRYLISYDLDRPGQEYHRLIVELKRLGARRVLYSQWVVVRTNTTAAKLRDYLRDGFMDANDRLLVVDITDAPYAWSNLLSNPAEP